MQLAQEWPFLEVRLVFFLAWLSQICGMRKMSGQKQELIFSRSGFGGETATFDIFGVLSLLLIMGRAKPGLLLLLLLLLLLMQLKEKLRNWRSEGRTPLFGFISQFCHISFGILRSVQKINCLPDRVDGGS